MTTAKASKIKPTGSKKPSERKNDLWRVYQDADPLVRDEIILELKKVNLFRHWLEYASKSGYNLHMAKAPLRDIFLRLLPQSAEYFGVKPQPN